MIVLNEYESAVFLAKDKCRHKDRKPIIKLLMHKLIDDVTTINGKDIPCKRPIPNPEYEPYKEGELKRIEREENEMVYKYLKEKYPNEDYADKFRSCHCDKM